MCFKNLKICLFSLQYNAVPSNPRPSLWKQNFIVFCLMSPYENGGAPGQILSTGTTVSRRVHILPCVNALFLLEAAYLLQEEKYNSGQSVISTRQAQLLKVLNYKTQAWERKCIEKTYCYNSQHRTVIKAQ